MIQVYPDSESLSLAAAELFVRQAEAAMEARGRFGVALSGGSTPRRTYELLARPPFSERVDWRRVHVFWGDERCVPENDPRSNALMARKALLDHVPIPPRQVHPMHCATSPGESADAYEADVRSFLGATPPPWLDLVLLGLGEDGHTASLFPDAPVLKEDEHWVATVYAREQGMHRMTLTPPFINRASLVAFLVMGKAKAEMLKTVLEGTDSSLVLPARFIRPQFEELIWLVDKEAAALL